jgi:hypothetical protein
LEEREAERLRTEQLREEERLRAEQALEAERRRAEQSREDERIESQRRTDALVGALQSRDVEERGPRQVPLTVKLKGLYDTFKPMIGHLPNELEAVSMWLLQFQNLCVKFEVEENVKVLVFQQLLSEKGRRVISKLSEEQAGNFQTLVASLQAEFKLSPGKYLELFLAVRKQPTETYLNYVSRLEMNYQQYLRSRNIELCDSNRDLFNLRISDVVKAALPPYLFNFILVRESGVGWLHPTALATCLDELVNEQAANRGGHQQHHSNSNPNQNVRPSFEASRPHSSNQNHRGNGGNRRPFGVNFSQNSENSYSGNGHTSNSNGNGGAHGEGWRRPSGFGRPSRNGGAPSRGIQRGRGSSHPPRSHSSDGNIPTRSVNFAGHMVRHDTIIEEDLQSESEITLVKSCVRDRVEPVKSAPVEEIISFDVNFVEDVSSYCDQSNLNCMFTASCDNQSMVCLLDTGASITLLNPSRVPAHLRTSENGRGRVDVKSVFGHVYTCDVYLLPIRLEEDTHQQQYSKDIPEVYIMVGVHPLVDATQAIFALADYNTLLANAQQYRNYFNNIYTHPDEHNNLIFDTNTNLEIECDDVTNHLHYDNMVELHDTNLFDEVENNCSENTIMSNVEDEIFEDEISSSGSTDDDVISDDNLVDSMGYDMSMNEVMAVEECRDLAACNAVTRSMSNARETQVSKNLCGLFFKEVILSEDAKSFAELQREDADLAEFFQLAKDKKGGFFTDSESNLLFKKVCKDGVEENLVLVLPQSKVKDVLSLAHDHLCHYGGLKTYQLVSQKFYFKSMKKRVLAYCAGCESCALRRRVTKADNVPISKVPKPMQSFSVLAMDVFGPLYMSAKKNQYILGIIDIATNYVFAYAIRDLKASTICGELLKCVSITGFPVAIINDNQSSQTSGLSQAVYQLLGIELRRTTPYHSNANASIERFWGICRQMLAHLSGTKFKHMWDTLLPYLLFAYHTMINESSGLSPFEMIYGHSCRSMLNVMFDRWSGVSELELPKLSKNDAEFFKNLQESIALAMESAMKTRMKSEDRYIDIYNKHAKAKSFQVNDQVMILQPSSSSKVKVTWIGPCSISRVMSDNSYLVHNPKDGSTKLLHSNKLRLFVPNVCHIGMIDYHDRDFGNIIEMPVFQAEVGNDEFDLRLDKLELDHLSNDERLKLVKLLKSYQDIFQTNQEV